VDAPASAGIGLLTVTVTGLDDAALPARSIAFAVSTCVPFGSVVVSKASEYGPVVTLPRVVSSTAKATEATPLRSSRVLALTVVVPLTGPAAGAARLTAGGVVSEVCCGDDTDTLRTTCWSVRPPVPAVKPHPQTAQIDTSPWSTTSRHYHVSFL